MTRCSSVSEMQNNAAAQDEGGFAILILSIAAAVASLGRDLRRASAIERTSPSYGLYIALAIGTVVLSWAFTHTIFALHYAHDSTASIRASQRPAGSPATASRITGTSSISPS